MDSRPEELAPEVAERAGQGPPDEHEQDIRRRTEALVVQLASLYNENTLLRERIRTLEGRTRPASPRR